MRNPLRTSYERRRGARPEERRGRPQAARQEPRQDRGAELRQDPDPEAVLSSAADIEPDAGRDLIVSSGEGAAAVVETDESLATRWVRQGLLTPVQARALERVVDSGPLDQAALERVVEAGLVTPSQATALRRSQAVEAPAAEVSAERLPSLPRLSLDARPLGLLLAGLGVLALLWSAVALFGELFGSGRHAPATELLDAVRLVACLLVTIGGRRMWRGLESGKPVVLIGLVLFGLSALLLGLRQLAHPVAMLLLVLAWTVLYYVTAASRLRPEAPSGPS